MQCIKLDLLYQFTRIITKNGQRIREYKAAREKILTRSDIEEGWSHASPFLYNFLTERGDYL